MVIDDLVHFAIQDYWSSDFQPAWSEMIWFILLYRIIGPVIFRLRWSEMIWFILLYRIIGP